jgi:hypothetical protein
LLLINFYTSVVTIPDKEKGKNLFKNACLTNNPKPDQEPELNVKSGPDPKKKIKKYGSTTLPLIKDDQTE